MRKRHIVFNLFFQPLFSMKFCVVLEKHIVRNMLYLNNYTSWQHSLDRSGFVGSVLIELSKVYDCLLHDLLLAKLQAYGLAQK